MERLFDNRTLRGVLVAGLGVLTLSACADTATGQVDPPTIQEIRDDGEYFELARPDGTEMLCWTYGSRGDGIYGESPSWFSVTCDWAGDYDGGSPNEITPPPINTIPTTEGN